MRCPQPEGKRGSLKWIQRAVEERWPELEEPIIERSPGARTLVWVSPLRDDQFAEYRDESFLECLGLAKLAGELAAFWPARGPQWDALARGDGGQVILVEAKAHIGEFCSPPSQASQRSMAMIKRAFSQFGERLSVRPNHSGQWHFNFYQYINRLAHLAWLVDAGIDAWLVMVGFTDDDDMPGRTTPEAWQAAYAVADFALGLPKRHSLSRRVIHVHPSVRGRA